MRERGRRKNKRRERGNNERGGGGRGRRNERLIEGRRKGLRRENIYKFFSNS